jgi:hypothetical protein
MDTLREVEIPDGSDIDLDLADQQPGDVEQPPKVAVTERGRRVVENYFGDLQEARAMASDPPSLGEVLTLLWKSPQVLANHWLLKFLVRVLYFPIAFPAIFICYFLVTAFVHPARGIVVGALLAAVIWLWFFA